MATISMEWTILERLLLAQAVNKYGDDDWIQVARTLKQHPLLQHSTRPEAFNQKNCSLQYYLMLENMETERRQPKSTSAIISQDMPNVVKLARQLYFQRVEELKESIKKDEDQFMEILSEIDDIKSGTWDDKLLKETNDLDSSSTPAESDNMTDTTDHDTKEINTAKSATDNTINDNDANEPSTSQSQPTQKQHDDLTAISDGIGVSVGIKRQPCDDEYSADHLDEYGIIETSSKRMRLEDDHFTANSPDKDYGRKDKETSQDHIPIPTNTQLTYPTSNTVDTSRTISTSTSTQAARELQTSTDTHERKSNTLTDISIASTTGSMESSGNEDSLTENEINTNK